MALIGVTAIGCQKEEEPESGPPTRAAVTFEGEPNPAYVGDWKTANGLSELNFQADGVAEIVAVSKSQGGTSVNRQQGRWGVSGGHVFVQYGDVVLKYTAKLEKNTLTLTQPNGIKAVYQRGGKTASRS